MPNSLRYRFGLALLGLSLFSASCSNLTSSPNSEPIVEESETEITQQFEGVTINVTGLKYPIGNAFEAHAETFSELTGAEIVFKTVPFFGDVYDTIVADYETETNDYE